MLTQEDLQAIGALIKTEAGPLIKAEGHRLDQKIETLGQKVGTLDQKIETLGQKVGTLGQKVGTLGQKVGTLDQKVGTLDQKVGTLDQKIETLDQKIEASIAFNEKAHAEIMEILIESTEVNGQEVKALKKRVNRLEEHTGIAKPHKN